MKTSVRIVVLNYNGLGLLEACLPSVARAAEKGPTRCALAVLDNCSTDGSADWVRRHAPRAEFVSAPANRIFCSYNAYVASVPEDVVVLLNNDIRVEEDFVAPLVRALEEDPRAFFAAPRALNFETGAYEGSLSKLEFRWGLPWGTARFAGHEQKIGRRGFSMQCGFGAFRRSYFLELGGFDDLYLPGTVEDADLCFRAWRRGYVGYYCPESVVHHIGQASFKRAFGASGIRRMNRRNLYLFVWKNIRDPLLLAEHALCLGPRLVKDAVTGRSEFLGGFADAVRLLPLALGRRRASRAEPSVVPDRRIFERSKEI